MNKIFINSGSEFEKEISYSRAAIVDNMIFVSGTTGYNYATMQIADDIETQAEQAFRNIEEAYKWREQH